MYRTICTHLWTDRKVQRLSRDGKLLFVYLITNPHSHMCGIYYLPEALIKTELGLTDTLCHTLWHTLSEIGVAHYDPETSTVFIVNMFGYQGKGEKNEKCAAKHLDTLHGSSLIDLFLQRYPTVTPFCSDTLSDTLCHRGTEADKRCPSVPNPVLLTSSSPNPDLKSNGHTQKKKPLRPISEDDQPSEKHFNFGRSLGIDVGPEWGKFKNYCLAHDKHYANFEAAFRNWLANAQAMQGGKRVLQ